MPGEPAFERLLANNRAWVEAQLWEDPGFFRKLSAGQRPFLLFLGCSDSRMSVNHMLGTQPGDLFIHRNIANQAPPHDPNFQAVLEYSIQTLQVGHVVVAGHTHCGGAGAALAGWDQGAVGAWLRPLRELVARHAEELRAVSGEVARQNRLAELNVEAQVHNILRAPVYQAALAANTAPRVHGWILDLATGLIREMEEWRGRG